MMICGKPDFAWKAKQKKKEKLKHTRTQNSYLFFSNGGNNKHIQHHENIFKLEVKRKLKIRKWKLTMFFRFPFFFSNHMNYRKSKKNQYATDKWGRMQINFQAKKYLEEQELYSQNFQRKAIWNIVISVNGLNFSTFEQKTTLSSLKFNHTL